MNVTRFLTATTRTDLLADLASAGFEYKKEDGTSRIPEPFEQTSNGKDSAIYLGHISLTDSEGNTTLSPLFHANVTECAGITFATEQDAPETPHNVFV